MENGEFASVVGVIKYVIGERRGERSLQNDSSLWYSS